MKEKTIIMKLNDFKFYTKSDLQKMEKQELIEIVIDLSNRLNTIDMYVKQLDSHLNELMREVIELGDKDDKTNKD